MRSRPHIASWRAPARHSLFRRDRRATDARAPSPLHEKVLDTSARPPNSGKGSGPGRLPSRVVYLRVQVPSCFGMSQQIYAWRLRVTVRYATTVTIAPAVATNRLPEPGFAIRAESVKMDICPATTEPVTPNRTSTGQAFCRLLTTN